MKIFLLCAVVLGGLVLACSRQVGQSVSPAPLVTVPLVDLNRYLGEWYEIARYPNSFQKNCLESRANYQLRPDGAIEVVNSCKDQRDGRLRQAKGKAWVVDTATNARLKVSFFWPFRGDYWIIDLGRDYEYAVVGTPNRKYLWILSRTPSMGDQAYSEILQRLAGQGYDRHKLIRH